MSAETSRCTLAVNSDYEVPPSKLSTPVYPPGQLPALIVSEGLTFRVIVVRPRSAKLTLFGAAFTHE